LILKLELYRNLKLLLVKGDLFLLYEKRYAKNINCQKEAPLKGNGSEIIHDKGIFFHETH